jgi:hypothetical protein
MIDILLKTVLTLFVMTLAVGILMKEQKIDHLTKMYGLFARNDGLKILCAHFKAYIQVGQ